MSFIEDLNLLINAGYSIIYVETLEEDRLEYTIRNFFKKNTNKSIYCWDFLDGYKPNFNMSKFASKNPLQALDLIQKLNEEIPALILLKDFNKFLSDYNVSIKLKNLSYSLKKNSKTLIILASEIEIPQTLKENIVILKFLLPNRKEIKLELIRLVNSLNKQIDSEIFDVLISSCQGLSIEKIRRILSKYITKYGLIRSNVTKFFIKEKQQLINQNKLLEIIETDISFANIGGLEILKKWFYVRKNSFTEKGKLYGLKVPRGLLLTGFQGTGKSLTAKAIANEWKLPLLKLDIGRLFTSLLGESERQVRDVIQLIESLQPCILWIDELDKIFIGSSKNADNGTTGRVLATILTWLSEKKSKVFIIATANDLSVLPVELIRKGRFDEIFYIRLPSLNERKKIFQVILNQLRPQDDITFDFHALSKKAFGFTGAEIEQAITDGMIIAFNEKREFTTSDLLIAIQDIVPFSQMYFESSKIEDTLAIAGHMRLASELFND